MNHDFYDKLPHEVLQPLPNLAPDNLKNKILFNMRRIFDLQISTIYRDIKKETRYFKNNILEIGCGVQPYRHLIPKEAKYFAMDWKDSSKYFYYHSKDTIYYDGEAFPLKNETFNVIFHTEVLEHVYDLENFLTECHRILSNNGKMFFTIPFAARYHYIPNDYWRLTPACIEKLLKDINFRNILITNRGNDITVAVVKLNTIFYRIILKKYSNFILRILNMLFFGILFIIPVVCLTIIAHISIFFKVGSPDDPLGYTVYCEK